MSNAKKYAGENGLRFDSLEHVARYGEERLKRLQEMIIGGEADYLDQLDYYETGAEVFLLYAQRAYELGNKRKGNELRKEAKNFTQLAQEIRGGGKRGYRRRLAVILPVEEPRVL